MKNLGKNSIYIALSFILMVLMIGTMLPMTVMAGTSEGNRTSNDTTIDEFKIAQTPPLMEEDTEWMEIEIDSNPTIGFRATGGLTMGLWTQSGDSFDTGDVNRVFDVGKANSSYTWQITPTALGNKVITAYSAASYYKSWNIEVVHTHTITYLSDDGTEIATYTEKQTADTIPSHVVTDDGGYSTWEIVSLGGLYGTALTTGAEVGDEVSSTETFNVLDDITLKGVVEPVEDLTIEVSGGDYGSETIGGELPLTIDVNGGAATYGVTSEKGTISTDENTGDGTITVSEPGNYTVTVNDGSEQTASDTFDIFKVNFNSNGGTEVSYQLLRMGVSSVYDATGDLSSLEQDGATMLSMEELPPLPVATRPEDPTKDNHLFIDWYTSEDEGNTLSEEPYDFDTQVTQSITLYAKWAEDMNGNEIDDATEDRISVRYIDNVDGIKAFEEKTYTNQLLYDNPDNYPKYDDDNIPDEINYPGHEFTGWQGEVNTTNNNYLFKAQWNIIEYTIDYVLEDGINSPENPTVYNAEETVTFAEPTNEGLIFDGWYSDSDFTELITGIPVGTTGDKTIYAKWVEEEFEIIPVPTSTPTVSVTTSSSTSTTSDAPVTGDTSNLMMWIFILFGSLFGAVKVGIKYRNQ